MAQCNCSYAFCVHVCTSFYVKCRYHNSFFYRANSYLLLLDACSNEKLQQIAATLRQKTDPIEMNANSQSVSRKERIYRSQLMLKIGFNSRRMFFVKLLLVWFVKMVVIVKPIE